MRSPTGRLGILSALTVCSLLANAPQATAQSWGIGSTDFESVRDSFFKGADLDRDFALSGEEQLLAMGSGRLAWASAPILFECDDRDGDGLCTYTEFLESGAALFGALDRDGDGRLMPDEIK